MNGQRGDDLDDDFVPDELVATSGEEDEVEHRLGDDIDGLLSADEDAEEAQLNKERSATEKKRKRREKEKERKAKVPIISCGCRAIH
jgi:protein CMS1